MQKVTSGGFRIPKLGAPTAHFGAKPIITTPQRSCIKIMFLHLFVILFTVGEWQTPPGADTPVGSDPPPPPCAVHAWRYGQQVGSTHPTGMVTCMAIFLP